MITGPRLIGALTSAALVHIVVFTLVHGHGLKAAPTQPRLAMVVLAPISAPESRATTPEPTPTRVTSPTLETIAPVEPSATTTAHSYDQQNAPARMAVESAADGFDYVPRDLLSVVPRPLAAIDVPFPESASGWFEANVQLSVFIDETGLVQKLRVDRSSGGSALESAAIQAFRQARFSPGQIDGRAVRSVIRVEVEFEARAIATQTPSR